jgi:O-antigen ligase
MLVRRDRDASRHPAMRSGTTAEANPFGQLLSSRMLLLTCATGCVLVSIMLSLSRGGMIAAGLACSICLATLWKSGRVESSLAGAVLALGCISIVGVIGFGGDGVEDRIGQLASADADEIDRLNARRSIWKADIAAIKAFPVTGTGVGSHRFVYPVYMEDLARFPGVSFSHAESSYIHLAMETGLCGVGLLIAGLLILLSRFGIYIVRENHTGRIAALAAVSGSLAGGTVHAVVDFIWYAPAIVVSTIVLGTIGLRICSGFRPNQGLRIPRVIWFTTGAACLLLFCRVQPHLANRVTGERLWFQYLNAQFDATSSSMV